jgi:4-amino-4-deoxy-L-arabinose transferase-like glycosyltransferase
MDAADEIPSKAGDPARRRRLLVSAVVVLAILIRGIVVAADSGYAPAHDAFDYDRHAISIAAGDGYPPTGYAAEGGASALRAPAYPYALGVTYAALGVEADGARTINVALGGATVLLIILLGWRIAGFRAGLIAGALAAVFPPLVLISRELLSENLFLPIALAVPLAAIRFRDSGQLRWAAAVGALCGLAALTRNPGPALVIPALVGIWWFRPRLGGRSLQAIALAVVVGIAVVVPWTARNAVEFGRFIPVTTSTGFALAGTYNDDSGGDANHTSWRAPNLVPAFEPLFENPGIDEGTLDATLRREAGDFARDHPGYVAEVAWSNALRLFMLEGGSVVDTVAPVEERGIGSGAAAAERIALALIAPLALIGAVLLVRRHRRERAQPEGGRGRLGRTAFVWLIPGLLLLTAALVAGLPRYRLPADPFFLLLAALTLERAWTWLHPRVNARSLGAVAAVGIAGLLGAGCGGNDESSVTTTASAPGEVTKEEFIAAAEPLCRSALKDTQALIEEAIRSGGGGASTSAELTTEAFVRPGLEVRSELGDELASLPAPPPDPNLDTFLQLFPASEGLIRLRLDAGERNDFSSIRELEDLLGALSIEQQAVAKAYGFTDCAADFATLEK